MILKHDIFDYVRPVVHLVDEGVYVPTMPLVLFEVALGVTIWKTDMTQSPCLLLLVEVQLVLRPILPTYMK